jgi:predicted adenine nucleotide alpha hydrolase (AANH) superfamily ATPase
MPLETLRAEGFELCGFFYNPNIHPLAEYLRRRTAALEAAAHSNLPVMFENDTDEGFDLPGWLNLAAQAMRRGSVWRCRMCYRLRMDKTALLAKTHGFDAFTGTLLYSVRQRHDLLRKEAERAAKIHGIKFLYRDFRPLWEAGITRSKELNLYRQNYCGCIYSEAERFAANLQKQRRKCSQMNAKCCLSDTELCSPKRRHTRTRI